MLRSFIAPFFIALLLCGCRRPLSEAERKVIGTWDRTGLDFNERITYRADHTMESTFADGSGTEPFAKGTWRLEGNTLVEDYAVPWHPVPNETPFPKQTSRMLILEFQRDKLVRESGRPPLIRVK